MNGKAKLILIVSVMVVLSMSVFSVGSVAAQSAEFSDGTVGTLVNGDEASRCHNSDGQVYQTGRVTSAPQDIQPGDDITVTAEIDAEIPAASDNVVFATVGLDDGTVLDVVEMSGLGSGTVTHFLSVPHSAEGKEIVWSFHPVFTESQARSQFQNDADDNFTPTCGTSGHAVSLGTVGSLLSSGNPFGDSDDNPVSRQTVINRVVQWNLNGEIDGTSFTRQQIVTFVVQWNLAS